MNEFYATVFSRKQIREKSVVKMFKMIKTKRQRLLFEDED